MGLNQIQKGAFLNFFNQGGYVLDFSTADFDGFCAEIVGVMPCEKYNYSKGRSLAIYANEAKECDVEKLFSALLQHYEFSQQIINEKEGNSPHYQQYLKIKELEPLLEKTEEANAVLSKTAISEFNNEYLEQRINEMIGKQKTDPTGAIGLAKELIESCCKTILEKKGIPYDGGEEMPKLITITTDCLHLSPKEIKDSLPLSKVLKQILQSLRAVAIGIADLRNQYGSGHGKSTSYHGLEERHAKLAVGASITLVNFLWDSYNLGYEAKEKNA